MRHYRAAMHCRGLARWKETLEAALTQADRSGLKKRLIAQYILPDLKALNLEKRLKLKLEIPVP